MPGVFIGYGAMDVTKLYKSIGFGGTHGPKPYKCIGIRWAVISQKPVVSAKKIRPSTGNEVCTKLFQDALLSIGQLRFRLN